MYEKTLREKIINTKEHNLLNLGSIISFFFHALLLTNIAYGSLLLSLSLME